MVEKLKAYFLLISSLLLMGISQYMHAYVPMSDSGHFSAGEAFMLGIAALWMWARVSDRLKQAKKKKI